MKTAKPNLKRIVMCVIIVFYAALTLAFLYYDFIDFTPRRADAIKYSTIVLSFLTSVFLWKDSINRSDGTVLSLAMLSTVVTDIFLVFLTKMYVTGMVMYGVTMSIYFFRYNKPKHAVILPFFAIIPLVLHLVFRLDPLLVVTSYYIQVLITNLYSSARCVSRGKFPKINGVLILLGLFIFVLGDITVVMRNFFGIQIYSKFIWIFYTPSQALLAFSAFNFAKRRQAGKEAAQ